MGYNDEVDADDGKWIKEREVNENQGNEQQSQRIIKLHHLVELKLLWTELRVCGKRKENSGTKDVLGARQTIVLVETLEQKVKYVISAGRLLLSGTLIDFPEESEKVTPIRFDTWKKEQEIDWAAVSASRSADPY